MFQLNKRRLSVFKYWYPTLSIASWSVFSLLKLVLLSDGGQGKYILLFLKNTIAQVFIECVLIDIGNSSTLNYCRGIKVKLVLELKHNNACFCFMLLMQNHKKISYVLTYVNSTYSKWRMYNFYKNPKMVSL